MCISIFKKDILCGRFFQPSHDKPFITFIFHNSIFKKLLSISINLRKFLKCLSADKTNLMAVLIIIIQLLEPRKILTFQISYWISKYNNFHGCFASCVQFSQWSQHFQISFSSLIFNTL